MINESFENFQNWLGFYIDLLNKVSEVKRLFNTKEKIEIAEAFVLKILLTWEILCEELLVDSFKSNTQNFQTLTQLRFSKRITGDLSKAIIEGERYMDFRGFDDLLKKSETYLSKRNNPFRRVPVECRRQIDAFYTIRNHIAHQSDKTNRAFRRVCRKDHKLRGFVTPGGLLLRKHPVEITFFNRYIQAFFQAAEAIKNSY